MMWTMFCIEIKYFFPLKSMPVENNMSILDRPEYVQLSGMNMYQQHQHKVSPASSSPTVSYLFCILMEFVITYFLTEFIQSLLFTLFKLDLQFELNLLYR